MEKDGNEKWLAWDKDVDVARSPVAGQFFGAFLLHWGWRAARVGLRYSDCWRRALSFRLLCAGRNAACCETHGNANRGSKRDDGIARLRLHVRYPWGEESGPSPASAVTTGKVDAAWVLSNRIPRRRIRGPLRPQPGTHPAAGQVTVTLDSVFGLRAHEEVMFASMSGMTDLNGKFALISVDRLQKKSFCAWLPLRFTPRRVDTWARIGAA